MLLWVNVGLFICIQFGFPHTKICGNFCFADFYGGNMLNTDRLCLGCMNDSGGEKVCEICGYDAETRNPSNALSTKLWLNDKYLVGKVTAYKDDCVVYIGWDNSDDSIVTIYEYFPSFAIRNPDKTVSVSEQDKFSFNGGLLSFIEISNKLNSPEFVSLIPTKDVFEENGTAYLIKPAFTGITLSDFLTRNGGTLKWEQVRPLFLPLMDTLKAMHDQGIIHGFLSPETILVGRDGKIRISTVNFWNNRSDVSSDSLQTGFAAIEQYNQGERTVSASSDIYALSATLFNVLIGTVPPASDLRIENDSLSVPSKFAEELPRNVLVALANGIQVLPEKRTVDIEGFRNELVYGNAADGSDINAPKKAQGTAAPAKKSAQKSGGVKSAVLAAVCTSLVFLVIVGVLCFTVFKDYIFPKEEIKRPVSSEQAPSSQVIGSVDKDSIEAPKQYSVPKLVGKWYSDIVDDEDDQYENFTITVKDKVFSDKYSKGTICEQSVKEGSSVLKGTEIQVVISLGPREIKIANVVGLDEMSAKMELLKQGFIYQNIEIIDKYDSEGLPGAVLEQKPAYGTKTNTDITVELYINSYTGEEDEDEDDSSSRR